MVDSLYNFFKKNKRIIIFLLVLFTPVLAGMLYAYMQGVWIGDYYMPASFWNDELLYYKQIEGVLEYGFPQGFFGYDESNAQSLTFSAWSPVIMSLYVVFGKVFGWSYNTPMVCNILFISIGMAFFAYKAKLGYKQMGLLIGFSMLFIPLTRYMLSGMTDCEMVAVIMIYMGFYAATVSEKESGNFTTGNIVGMVICSIFLTLMRPYFLLLFIAPVCYEFKKSKIGAWVIGIIAGITMGAYAYIAGKFTATYFFPLIDTEWIEAIKYSPLGGIKNAVLLFFDGLQDIYEMCVNGIKYGQVAGGLWSLFIVLLIVIFVIAIRNKSLRICAFIMIALMGAVVMFYDINVGSRHLLPFIVIAVMLLIFNDYKIVSLGVLAVVIILFSTRMEAEPYTYLLPVYDEHRAETIEELQEKLENKIVVEKTEDYWDNTVIWLLYDETTLTWQNLYALPKGVGISVCTPDYVINFQDDLKARYIAVNVGQRIERLISEAGAQKLAEQDGVAFYKLRK